MAKKNNNESQEEQQVTPVANNKLNEPAFEKEQFLSSPDYTVGQRAFIGAIDDKEFPLTKSELNKKLGVK